MTFLSVPFLIMGLFFLLVAGVGTIRLPDFYTRGHALGVTDTLGTFLLLFGLIFHFGWDVVSAKILFVIFFINVANPTVTHVLYRAALRSGLKPWTKDHV